MCDVGEQEGSQILHACQECEAKFSESRDLKHHVHIHTSGKPYKCHDCDLEFSNSNEIKCHMYKHLRENRYTCQVCRDFFKEHHIKMYTRENPHLVVIVLDSFWMCAT